MDRINRFLAKRPVKHKKVLKYNDKTYEVTKEDIKRVRAYRSRKCLDPTFKKSRQLNLAFSSVPIDPLPKKTVADNAVLFVEKARRYYAKHPVKERKPDDRNKVVDVWEDDTLETLRDYRQEWVYSIKEPYDKPIEECVFSREHLKEELRRVFLHHYRPRELKERRIEELLPKLPDKSELRPYPEEMGREWRIPGKKYITSAFLCAVEEGSLAVWDLAFGKKVHCITVDEPINGVFADGREIVFATDKKLFRVVDGAAVLLHESKTRIKDVSVDDGYVAVLAGKGVRVYDLATMECMKSMAIKYESPHRVSISNGVVYVSTANGLVMEAEERVDVKTLNYVIDFAVKGRSIYVINNLNRLIVMSRDGEKECSIKKNIVQHEMGREVRVHKILNLFAILFSDEIGIYKAVGNEFVPAHVIPGRFKTIAWHDKLPWLYAGKSSKVVLYT